MNPVGRRGEQRRGADGCGQRRLYLSAAAALLRYAHFLDGHFEFETDFLAHQAEGLAFWRILEAAVGIDCGGEGELAATGDVVVDDDDDDDVQEQEQEPQGYLEQDFFADFDWSSGSSGGGSSGGGG